MCLIEPAARPAGFWLRLSELHRMRAEPWLPLFLLHFHLMLSDFSQLLQGHCLPEPVPLPAAFSLLQAELWQHLPDSSLHPADFWHYQAGSYCRQAAFSLLQAESFHLLTGLWHLQGLSFPLQALSSHRQAAARRPDTLFCHSEDLCLPGPAVL